MILKYKTKTPVIEEGCFIAKNATIIGDVTLHKEASVWFGSVVRADKACIEIGAYSNIQDNCTLHTDPDHHIEIGNYVTVGHQAIIHGCTIEDETLIGMGSTILNGAHIGKHCIIGANALITENMQVPDGSVVVGCPGKIIKQVSDRQRAHIIENAREYALLKEDYKED